ncbi:RDD family protein [Litorimonas sp. RW-G-Af-16]|uniref:RDD family protein n=1 Tax=Litorimonas sp. RW-G-Af-16 TaxID=3241168 RepID=UPI00390CA692
MSETVEQIQARMKKRRASMKYEDYRNKYRRSLVTPEGIDLKIELADIGARFGALFIDLIIMVVIMIASFFIVVYGVTGMSSLGRQAVSEFALSLLILVFFFLRSFYFMAFEMGPRAATPGKRIMKIRVAARGKPRLTANAVFARNALREIELFLPISFLFGAGSNGVDGWINLFGMIWVGIFVLFPFFNKDNLRGGDLIAGTWVVKAPRPVLAQDLATVADGLSAQFAFTPEQIDAYGVKELHVLEDVLRRKDPTVMNDVAIRIRRKIGWVSESAGERDIDFLQAYYKALRGRLETKLLMGVRREDKFDRR